MCWLSDGVVVCVVSPEESLGFPRNLIWWGKNCAPKPASGGAGKAKLDMRDKLPASNSIVLRNNNIVRVLFKEEDTLLWQYSS